MGENEGQTGYFGEVVRPYLLRSPQFQDTRLDSVRKVALLGLTLLCVRSLRTLWVTCCLLASYLCGVLVLPRSLAGTIFCCPADGVLRSCICPHLLAVAGGFPRPRFEEAACSFVSVTSCRIGAPVTIVDFILSSVLLLLRQTV